MSRGANKISIWICKEEPQKNGTSYWWTNRTHALELEIDSSTIEDTPISSFLEYKHGSNMQTYWPFLYMCSSSSWFSIFLSDMRFQAINDSNLAIVACLKGEQKARMPWWAPSCLSVAFAKSAKRNRQSRVVSLKLEPWNVYLRPRVYACM